MLEPGDLTRSLTGIGARDDGSLFDELMAKYQQPTRHYHSDRHIAACLEHFMRYKLLALSPAEIEVAIWFHDAIHDTQATDNEEQSAEWARRYLTQNGAAGNVVQRIVALILATRTHTAIDKDMALLIDIDLGILGAPGPAFDAYDQQIREEYHWVPERDYRVARADILEGFLKRDRIYQTSAIRDQLEMQARSNLAQKIQELRR